MNVVPTERLLVNFFYGPPAGHAVEARDYYVGSARRLTATQARTVVTSTAPGYVPHQQVRLELPESARATAARPRRSQPTRSPRSSAPRA